MVGEGCGSGHGGGALDGESLTFLMCTDKMECPVCFELLGTCIETRLPCKHSVCLRCLLKLPSPRCPMCRTDVSRHIPPDRAPTRPLSVHSIMTQFHDAERLTESVLMSRIHTGPLLLRPAPLRRLVIEREESGA